MHINNLTEVQLEVLGLLQEEAAELIQELSKVRRNGTDFKRHSKDVTNIQHVGRELVDLQILIDIAAYAGLFDKVEDLTSYTVDKKERLKTWTNLPNSIIESI